MKHIKLYSCLSEEFIKGAWEKFVKEDDKDKTVKIHPDYRRYNGMTASVSFFKL